jgi:hypothetical protein
MALTYQERWESQSGSIGRNPGGDLSWIVSGDPVADNADVGTVIETYIFTWLGEVYNEEYLDACDYEWIAPGTWLVKAKYGSPEDWRPDGEASFTFNTAGGNQHITVARSHVQTYNNSSGAITGPFDGLLNVDDDTRNVNGLDIPTAAFAFQITQYVLPTLVTDDYVQSLYTLTDCVNANSFSIDIDGVSMTFPAGEVQFQGATGAKRGYGDFEITMNFAANPNQSNLTVGSGSGAVTGVVKNGWDYLWVSYLKQKDTANKVLAPVINYVMVDRVFDYENFTGLVLGSSVPTEPFGGNPLA